VQRIRSDARSRADMVGDAIETLRRSHSVDALRSVISESLEACHRSGGGSGPAPS
jgi:hypothetical protein